MLIIAFLLIMEYGSTAVHVYALQEKHLENSIISYVLGDCFAQLLVMIFKKILEVRWHVVSIVLFLNFMWGNCII